MPNVPELRRARVCGLAALLVVAALAFPVDGVAQEPAHASVERTHDVRTGDTLWDLARTYLGDPFLWPEIFRVNVAAIRDPALIFPSTRLLIPGRPGRVAATPAVPGEPERTVFFRQALRTGEQPDLLIRAAGTEDVPFISPGDFYSAGFVAEDWEVSRLGFLAERQTVTVVPLAITPLIGLYDTVYLSVTEPGALRPGDRVQLAREESRIRGLGRVYRVTGMVRVAEVNGTTATAEVVEVFHTIREGDLALPVLPFPVEPGVSPRPAEGGIEGRVVAFQDPNLIQMTQNVVFVDLGAAAGVREGDELEVYIPEQQRRWGIRPEIPVAVLRVVRVTEGVASARVHTLDHPALEAGLPVRVVSRMP